MQFRPVICSMHGRSFRGHGVSRVMKSMLFHFCAVCWRDRRRCEEHMIAVTK